MNNKKFKKKYIVEYQNSFEDMSAEQWHFTESFEIIAENYEDVKEKAKEFGGSIGLDYEIESKKTGSSRHTRYNYLGGEIISIKEIVIIITEIITIDEVLKQYLAKHPEELFSLTPRKFEELVAEILKDCGFEVELTPTSRDGGIDIYAYFKNQICNMLTFVECKKYSPDRPVGSEIVQRLYGIQQSHHANMSMIVTTSYFSSPAKKEANRYENQMSLRDFNDLKIWLSKYT